MYLAFAGDKQTDFLITIILKYQYRKTEYLYEWNSGKPSLEILRIIWQVLLEICLCNI